MYPLTFKPILKERVWGGRKLEQLYNKLLPPDVLIGESWEISDRPEDLSVIANGPWAGKDLHWLIKHHGHDLMGPAALYRDRFPLLIKILDAREKLSLQVHPRANEAVALGGEPKTELWYVAEAEPDAELYVGLRRGCTREEFTERLRDGTVADCFHRVRVHAGDAMFLPSGRVHAIGAGTVLFEIQQNSDTTYRVFDWNRVGLNGKPRELHVQQSLECIDFADFEPALVQPVRKKPGLRSLVEHSLFKVRVSILSVGEELPLVAGKMQIIGVVDGELELRAAECELRVGPGGFVLLAASLDAVRTRAAKPATCLCVQAGEVPFA